MREFSVIAIQIASALDAAHRKGVVHLHLKPGNVTLTRSAEATALPRAQRRAGAKPKARSD